MRVLVLTFNRTLRGYIDHLAREQAYADGDDVHLEVATFGSWAQGLLGSIVLEHEPRNARLDQLAGLHFGWRPDFLHDEVEYVLGRFLPEDLSDYLDARRVGRGRSPQVDRHSRQLLLDTVIAPYTRWKREREVADWHDLAVSLARRRHTAPYDVVIIDEAQDFSANQIRAVVNHLSTEFTCTFIRDSTQRIYSNFFVWRDVGVDFDAGHSRELRVNYRNTRQIAAFARPLVDGLEPTEDRALPSFSDCARDGIRPRVLHGLYSAQLDWVIGYLRSAEVRDDQTVAFLHPKGWFGELRRRLDREQIRWTSLTREAAWPPGDERIALCTMHSAKGLEFDHVIIIGYNAEVVEHGDEADDSQREAQRRLLAMAVGRARESFVLGFKPDDAPTLIDHLDPATYDDVQL